MYSLGYYNNTILFKTEDEWNVFFKFVGREKQLDILIFERSEEIPILCPFGKFKFLIKYISLP